MSLCLDLLADKAEIQLYLYQGRQVFLVLHSINVI